MSKLYDPSAMKAWPGGYLTGDQAQLKVDGLLREVRSRRRQLGQMTRALDPDSAKHRIPDAVYEVSRKIDGEFTCLVYRGGDICTLNPGGTLRAVAPFLKEAAKRLKKAGIKSALIGGELHVLREDGERPRVHDVVRVARAPQSEQEVAQLAFAAFNIYELDGQDLSIRYHEAVARLKELFGDGERVFPVDSVTVEGTAAVMKQFRQWVLKESAEGIVARSPSAGVFKVKPRHSLDLAVIGFSEGLDDRQGMVHDLLLAVVRPSGRFQIAGRVGGGFSDEDRVSLLDTLSQRVVDSDFREVNSERVAYQMVEPGIVIEIECLDLIARTSRGNTIDRMVLEWNADKSAWEGIRRLPLCSILSPQFVRIREDKQADVDDVRLSQFTDIIDIPDVDRVAAEEALPAAQVLARLVGTKQAKGKTMVRKIVAIKTNKEELSNEHPAFVLHITDFSPNRADKLQFELRVTSNREQLDELLEAARASKFKKGWVVAE